MSEEILCDGVTRDLKVLIDPGVGSRS